VKDDEYEGHEQAKKVTKMGVTSPFGRNAELNRRCKSFACA
jgi:hypothetical protein